MTPLYVDRVSAALHDKRDRFRLSEQKIADSLNRLEGVVHNFEMMTLREIADRLEAIGPDARFGALPTREQEELPLLIPFEEGRRWSHHRQAREWAMDILSGVTTVAVDGSAIDPSGDLSVQVGMIQIGWFQNPHDTAQSYVKDVTVQIVSPDDLEGRDPPDMEMAWLRTRGELDRIIQFMQAHKGARAVAFLDGTLTISFVRNMDEERQKQYRDLVREVLRQSKESRIPLVGYIDSSKSIDLMTLLLSLSSGAKQGYDRTRSLGVTDAALLRADPRGMGWGGRSRTFICNRDDSVIGNEYYEDICFTYFQTTQGNPPARLEIPRWVFEDPKLYEWVINVVRAECVVGVGYPYPIETADAVAVLTGEDRERFLRLFQEFAANENISVYMGKKVTSKRGRRR